MIFFCINNLKHSWQRVAKVNLSSYHKFDENNNQIDNSNYFNIKVGTMERDEEKQFKRKTREVIFLLDTGAENTNLNKEISNEYGSLKGYSLISFGNLLSETTEVYVIRLIINRKDFLVTSTSTPLNILGNNFLRECNFTHGYELDEFIISEINYNINEGPIALEGDFYDSKEDVISDGFGFIIEEIKLMSENQLIEKILNLESQISTFRILVRNNRPKFDFEKLKQNNDNLKTI